MTVVVDQPWGPLLPRGGTALPVVGLKSSAAPPEAQKFEPASTHRVAETQAAAFSAPVPTTLFMPRPDDRAPVAGFSGTAWPVDGSPSSFPTARHWVTEGQATALNMAARSEMA
jgi:hypothetical protein